MYGDVREQLEKILNQPEDPADFPCSCQRCGCEKHQCPIRTVRSRYSANLKTFYQQEFVNQPLERSKNIYNSNKLQRARIPHHIDSVTTYKVPYLFHTSVERLYWTNARCSASQDSGTLSCNTCALLWLNCIQNGVRELGNESTTPQGGGEGSLFVAFQGNYDLWEQFRAG